MEKSLIFNYSDYKAYLKYLTGQSRGQLSRFAEIAGCQPAYLWRVLNEDIHITLDHAYKISQHMGHDELSQSFFMTLVEVARCASIEYRRFLETKISNLQNEFINLQKSSQKPELDNTQRDFDYHSQWFIAAIHFFSSKPGGVSITEIGQFLGISKVTAENAIEKLLKYSYIKKDGQRYYFVKGTGHLSKDTPILPLFHQNWRQMAVVDSFNKNSEGFHYTNLQMISSEDFIKIRSLINQCIREVSQISNDSASEQLIVFNCDFFHLTT